MDKTCVSLADKSYSGEGRGSEAVERREKYDVRLLRVGKVMKVVTYMKLLQRISQERGGRQYQAT